MSSTTTVTLEGIEFTITHVPDPSTVTPKISPWGKTTFAMKNPKWDIDGEINTTVSFEVETNKDGSRPRFKAIKH